MKNLYVLVYVNGEFYNRSTHREDIPAFKCLYDAEQYHGKLEYRLARKLIIVEYKPSPSHCGAV
jgi:hypothetical protein